MTTDTKYISTLDKDKQEKVDQLIDKYEVPVVGTGYIDIILPRDRFEKFISDLTDLNIAIESISWWCHATDSNKKDLGCPHGMGGPMTKYGWFSEIVQEHDELTNDYDNEPIKTINQRALSAIKNKRTENYDGTTWTFDKTYCLTPGLWLHVPHEWTRKEK